MKSANNLNTIEFRSYIGTKLTYKGYNMVVSEITPRGIALYEPSSGLKATVSVEKFKEIRKERTYYRNA